MHPYFTLAARVAMLRSSTAIQPASQTADKTAPDASQLPQRATSTSAAAMTVLSFALSNIVARIRGIPAAASGWRFDSTNWNTSISPKHKQLRTPAYRHLQQHAQLDTALRLEVGRRTNANSLPRCAPRRKYQQLRHSLCQTITRIPRI
jgi:hypothetical protein